MFNSIRLKLTLWYTGVLALVIVAFAVLIYFFTVRELSRDLDARLAEMSRNFVVALESEQADTEENRSPEQTLNETIDELNFRDYQFVILSKDGETIASTADVKLPQDTRISPSSFGEIKLEKKIFRVYSSPLEKAGKNYRLLVLHPLGEQIEFQSRLKRLFFTVVPLALLLAAFGGFFLARKSFQPIVEMSGQARQITATNLHERLPVKNERDELGNLAQTFNNLLARLENSFEQQRRFMADASHELRTPLAIVRGESEVALSKETRPNAELRESLAIVNDESKRLSKIVEDLFTLARADAGQYRIADEKVYLDELVAECVRAVQVLAEKREIKFEFEIAGEMPLRGDEQLLRRLFINLLDNAIKYNRDGGTISVSAQIEKSEHRIVIADTGEGISDADTTKIFERFYRADKARSRQTETETSGAGLGLSIAQWIAEIHRGRIELTESDASGSIFTVSFPIAE